MYPLGLLVGLMWIMASNAIEMIKSKEATLMILGFLHIVSVFLFSITINRLKQKVDLLVIENANYNSKSP